MTMRAWAMVMALAAAPCMAAPAPELVGAFGASGSPLPSAEAYLQRLRQPVAPPPSPAAGYQPKTAFDNTPYRFDMSQNGRRMTAEEFDAWMKSRGIRVATGKPATASTQGEAPAAAAAPAAATPACQASAQVTC
jgi:rare lipoprotein A